MPKSVEFPQVVLSHNKFLSQLKKVALDVEYQEPNKHLAKLVVSWLPVLAKLFPASGNPPARTENLEEEVQPRCPPAKAKKSWYDHHHHGIS